MLQKFFLFFVLLTALQSGTAQTNASGILELKDALAQKWLSMQLEGKGGHQGESLRMVCKNLRGKYFRVRIPQGLLMEPADSSAQTLVVAEEYLVAITPKTPVEVLIKTFCTQSGEISPRVAEPFAIGAMAPTALCNLLKFMTEKNKTDVAEAQTAVWCITNGNPIGSIGDAELIKFVADQLGRPVPGYRIRHQKVEYVPGERAELGKALVVEGNFRFYLEKDERVVMVLLDGEDKLIKQVSKEETMIAGEHRSGLRLEVYNLDPGKYTLRMKTVGGHVIKDMEVEF
jgi:hypothetical protein